jgi:hypothetical protein
MVALISREGMKAPGASSQSPRDTSTSRSRTMPALWRAVMAAGWRA